MATPQARAATAETKTTMSPSPRFLTSVPPDSAMAWRRIEKCPRRTSSAASAERRCDNSVEPTTSVKRIVALSVLKKSPPRLEDTRVCDGRNVPPRGPDAVLLRPGPALDFGTQGAREPERDLGTKGASPHGNVSHQAAVYIHLARCATCLIHSCGGR